MSDTPGDLWLHHPANDASGKIDWTLEQEWRHPKALEFSGLNNDDICIFVENDAEVTALREIAPWSVICVPE